jgi:hypothetical protein
MVTAQCQTCVHVKRDGVVKTVPFHYVLRIATMVANVLLQIHVNAVSGKTPGEMLVAFPRFRLQMAAPNLQDGRE